MEASRFRDTVGVGWPISRTAAIFHSTLELLEGGEVLVLDALRHKSHETHFNLDQALAVVECLKPRQTWFIHMTHDLQHAETNAGLPEGVELSYDGLEIELSSFDPSKWVL